MTTTKTTTSRASCNIATMCPVFACAIGLLCAVPVAGQSPLPGAPSGVRAAQAEVRIARALATLYDELVPMSVEMADAGTAPFAAGGGMMRGGQQHDQTMTGEIARIALERVTAQEQLKLAEFRLNAALGRPLDAPIEDLPPRPTRPRPVSGAPDTSPVPPSRELLEARTRLAAAEERLRIMNTTVVPQARIAFDGARGAYAAGDASFAEMVEAHHRQVEARVQLACIDAEYERALVALEAAEGR